MPIKLNNERLPGKNVKTLGEKPLLQYELDNLIQIQAINKIYVYCSDEAIMPFIPEHVSFLRRPEYLDLPTSNFTQIFEAFMNTVDADIYVYSHATAPFISVNTMNECINAVVSGKYDSAFCADASNIPRSQDLNPVYRETSGVYVFKKEVFEKYRRRIGKNPYIKEVSFKEAVDINNPEDFDLAKALLNTNI